MKRTVETFKNNKQKGKKISMLTAYDYTTAKLFDSCSIDGILVGDSLGMVCLGYKNTLNVTLEDMLHHTKAVSRGVKNALLVGDMPFMSYQTSVYDAVKNAGRLVQEAGAEAIKLEGCDNILPQVKAIIKAQIPVMGHLGLTPQSINIFGGYKIQGKEQTKAQKFIEDAKKLEDAGVFSIVLECVPMELAEMITNAVSVPTIGIGSGVKCDGQILVYQDMFNMYSDISPKFAKTYVNIGELMKSGVEKYIEEVENEIFPEKKHSYTFEKN